MKLGEAMYAAQQGAEGAEAGPAPEQGAKDDVIDADFREVVAKVSELRPISEETVTTAEEKMVFKLPKQLEN